MPKFRKKPVVIDAEQFRISDKPYPADVVAVLYEFGDGADEVRVRGEYNLTTEIRDGLNVGFGIKTLEGWHIVTDGDYIITGVAGERYPCKPSIFAATYEPAEPTA